MTSHYYLKEGKNLSKEGNHDEAIKYYNKAINLESKNYNAIYNKGLALIKLGRYAKAHDCISKALKLNPQNHKIWNVNKLYALGCSHYDNNEPEQAKKCLKEAMELHPWDGNIWFDIGNKLDEHGQYEDSSYCFQKVRWLHSALLEGELDRVIRLGLAFEEVGQDEKALKCYERASRLLSDDTTIHYRIGFSLFRLGRYSESLSHFTKVIIYEPVHFNAHFMLGLAYTQLNEYQNALDHFQMACNLHPHDWQAWQYCGESNERIGNKKRAEICFKKANELKNSI